MAILPRVGGKAEGLGGNPDSFHVLRALCSHCRDAGKAQQCRDPSRPSRGTAAHLGLAGPKNPASSLSQAIARPIAPCRKIGAVKETQNLPQTIEMRHILIWIEKVAPFVAHYFICSRPFSVWKTPPRSTRPSPARAGFSTATRLSAISLLGKGGRNPATLALSGRWVENGRLDHHFVHEAVNAGTARAVDEIAGERSQSWADGPPQSCGCSRGEPGP